MNAVMFIGHKEAFCDTGKIRDAIVELIEKNGLTEFLLGGMGQFDMICARILCELKKKYRFLRVYLVIPHLGFRVTDIECYDEIIFPQELEGVFFKQCIPRRNQYMVDHAAVAICYVKHSWGGAYQTYRYAKEKGLYIIDIP